MYTYALTNLPPGGIYNISLVAIVHLPSPVVGPFTPSPLQVPGLLRMIIIALAYSNNIILPVVSVSGEGSRVAGTSYTLTCTVTVPSGVQLLSIQWLGQETSPPAQISSGLYISNATVTLGTPPPTNAVYTCRATYTLSGVTSQRVQDNIFSINVICV